MMRPQAALRIGALLAARLATTRRMVTGIGSTFSAGPGPSAEVSMGE